MITTHECKDTITQTNLKMNFIISCTLILSKSSTVVNEKIFSRWTAMQTM